MIGVILIMRAQPGMMEELVAFWREVAADVPATEPGCLQISVTRDSNDPAQIVIFERYASQADLDNHHDTAYSKNARPRLEKLRVAPIQRIVGPIVT